MVQGHFGLVNVLQGPVRIQYNLELGFVKGREGQGMTPLKHYHMLGDSSRVPLSPTQTQKELGKWDFLSFTDSNITDIFGVDVFFLLFTSD